MRGERKKTTINTYVYAKRKQTDVTAERNITRSELRVDGRRVRVGVHVYMYVCVCGCGCVCVCVRRGGCRYTSDRVAGR